MSKYILKAEATRVVQKNDRGIVTYRKRYKRGDVVDVSYIEAAHLQRLLDAGHIVLDDGTVPENAEDATAAAAAASVAASSTGTVADLGSTATTGGEKESENESEEDDEEADVVEDFESYDYSTLQRLAKDRTGDGSGGKQDLIDRLVAHSAK